MLGLGQEVCRDEFRHCGIIRDDQDLTRTCEHIDIDLTEDQALRCIYIDIARAADLIDTRDRLRTIGHRSDRLGTADLIDLGSAGDAGSSEDNRSDRTIGTRRCAQYDTRASGCSCRNNIHEDCGRERSRAARYIDTCDADRTDAHADLRAFCHIHLKAGLDLSLVEGQDIGGCFLDDLDQIRIKRCDRVSDLLVCHADIGSIDVRLIEFLRVLKDCRIAILLDVIDHVVHIVF